MNTGIYLAKIDKIKMFAKGNSVHGDWSMFELSISIHSNGNRRSVTFAEPSWILQDAYADYFKSKKGDFREWRQLIGKTVLAFWEEDEDPFIIAIVK